MTTDEIKALIAGATPGPWGIGPAYISEVNAPNGLTVASCWYRQCEGASITVSGINPVSPEESAANARLIAAAPDLAALALRQAERDRIEAQRRAEEAARQKREADTAHRARIRDDIATSMNGFTDEAAARLIADAILDGAIPHVKAVL